MAAIKDLLKSKGRDFFSIAPNASVYEALELLAEKNIGALLVVENDKLVGIFSERDYARKVILKGKTSRETAVSELMTRTIFFVTPENTLEESLALMTSKSIRHLPVVEYGRLAGIVTLGDVVKRIIDDQGFTIQQLENMITGEYGM